MKTTIPVPANTTASPDRNVKQVILKNCTPFTNCISKISIAQVNNAKYLDVSCQRTSCWNIVVTIQKHQEIYANIAEMS